MRRFRDMIARSGHAACRPGGPRGRVRSESGFTLVEMLAALAVLVLLTGVIVTGMTVAMKVYHESTFTSESAVLERTITSALSDPLRYTTTYTDAATSQTGYTIVYRDDDKNGKVSSTSPLLYADDAGQLYLKDGNSAGEGIKLLNGSAYTDCIVTNVKCDFSKVSTDRTISGSYTIESTIDPSLTKDCTFSFSVLDATKK